MEIDKLVLDTSISVVRGLYLILMNTNDKELQEACRHMIHVLHEKQLLPAMEFWHSFSK